ncbi:MAG: hypothetical protein SFV51_12185 [Bryobacteraceae bacterium]|nr:hypothetical protein [Bryobacteraceae bacterium]
MHSATLIRWQRPDGSSGPMLGEGRLAVTFSVPYSYELWWKHPVSKQCDRPVPAAGGAPIEVRAVLEGCFLAAGEQIHMLSGGSVSVAAATPGPASPDQLLAALLGIHPCQGSGQDTAGEPALDQIATMDPAGAAARWRNGEMAQLERLCLNWISMVCLHAAPSSARSVWVEARLRAWRNAGSDPEAILAALRRLHDALVAETAHAVEAAVAEQCARTIPFALPAHLPLDETESAVHWLDPVMIPVRLPDFDKISPELIRRLRVESVGQGMLIGYEPADGALAGLLQHSVTVAAPAETVVLESRAVLGQEHARRLAASAGIDCPPPIAQTQGEVEVRIGYPLRAQSLKLWLKLPPEKTWEHFELAARLSAVLQESMRKWLPAAVLSAPNAYEDVAAAAALMAYRSSRIYRSRGRAAYTYDVLDPQHVQTFCKTAEASLSAALNQLKRSLRAGGKADLAEKYIDKNIKRHILPVRGRLPRLIAGLLTAEAGIVEALFCLAEQLGRTTGRRQAAQRRGDRLGKELARPIGNGLKKALRGYDLGWLAPLVLGDLTRVLGGEETRGVSVTLRAAGWLTGTCGSTSSGGGR